VDSFATFSAGLFGSSPGTAYIESMTGIAMGGRTGSQKFLLDWFGPSM
jgi:AGZA family xanthine/uracil permease-like MFS transporter